jgi:hypothetical protein
MDVQTASGMDVQTHDAEDGSLATPAPEDELGGAEVEPGEKCGDTPMGVCTTADPVVHALGLYSLDFRCCMSGQLPKHLPHQYEH